MSIVVYNSDMSEEQQHETLLAVYIYTEDNDIASYIVKEFDRRHGRTWHCIMGNSGYWVQHQGNSYICFSVDGKRITLFRTG